MSDTRELIEAAIAEGKLKRIPTGESGIVRKTSGKPERPTRFHPEHCGKGDRVQRHRTLDEIDGTFP